MRALMRIAPQRQTLAVATSVRTICMRVTHRTPQMHPMRMAPNVRSMSARSTPLATLKPGKRSEPSDARDCDRALASQKNLGCRRNACVNERQDRMQTNPFAGNAMLVDGVNRKSGLCCELCGIAVFGELADPCSNLL
jgi:hypothetical protein